MYRGDADFDSVPWAVATVGISRSAAVRDADPGWPGDDGAARCGGDMLVLDRATAIHPGYAHAAVSRARPGWPAVDVRREVRALFPPGRPTTSPTAAPPGNACRPPRRSGDEPRHHRAQCRVRFGLAFQYVDGGEPAASSIRRSVVGSSS